MTVDIGDISVLMRSEGDLRGEAIAELLAGLPVHPGPPTVTVSFLHAQPPLPTRAPDQTFEDMRVWRDNDELFLQDATDVRAHVSGHQAWIGGQTNDLSRAFQQLFLPTITHQLAHQGRFVLHAAAIARTSVAYLVLGHTGAGKSTLGFAAAEAGWQLLSDDMVVLRPSLDTLQVAGIARRAAVPGELGRRPPGVRMLADDPRARWELPTRALVPGWFRLGGVIRVGHGSSPEGDLGPATARGVLHAALESFFCARDPALLRRFFSHAAAISRLPSWELGHGCEPSSRLDAARRLLASVEPPVPVFRG